MFHESRFLYLTLNLLALFAFPQANAADWDPGTPMWEMIEQPKSGPGDVLLCSHSECEDACCEPACCEEACGGDGCGNGCGNGCGGLFGGLLGSGGDTPLSVWVWGGPTYASASVESVFGFSEGIIAGYRITPAVGLYGSFGFNHSGHSSQFLGTVGIQRFGNPNGDGLLDRANIWVLWDQYTDTQFDDLYLHQFRFNFGYASSETGEIGMMFNVSTSGNLGAGGISPLGGISTMAAGGFIGPYLRRELDNGIELTGAVGYSDGTGGAGVGVQARMPMGDTNNIVLDTKYAGGDAYGLGLIYEVGLGRADTRAY